MYLLHLGSPGDHSLEAAYSFPLAWLPCGPIRQWAAAVGCRVAYAGIPRTGSLPVSQFSLTVLSVNLGENKKPPNNGGGGGAARCAWTRGCAGGDLCRS